MRGLDRTVERELARIAERQHGLVTRAGLVAAGVSDDGIRQQLIAGGLWRVHRGVYRVGHRAPNLDTTYLAAVLACGQGALLCGLAAAHLHRLVKGPPPLPAVLTGTERRIPRVHTVRSRTQLADEERAAVRGIPVTSVPRTLVDLAALLPLDALARTCHEAGIRHRTTPAQVAAILARRPTAKGHANLELVLGRRVAVTLSRLERGFRRLLHAHGLALPDEMNRPAGGHRVDARWIARRLTVELDSFTFHNSRHSWEQDRRRERAAYARGDAHRRYTWRDVFEDPRAMLAELRALLTDRPA